MTYVFYGSLPLASGQHSASYTLLVLCIYTYMYSVFYIHRVLNTDNMSIVGLTIDYGPYGFMDRYDPGHICNGSGLPNTCTVYLYTNSTPNMCNV